MAARGAVDTVEVRPTIWRTCRALANRKRLALLQAVAPDRSLTVGQLAAATGLDVTLTSRYARALNARGLLTARRSSRWVHYAPARGGLADVQPLVDAVFDTLAGSDGGAEEVYRLATAFTHPRRVLLARACRKGPARYTGLARATGISLRALDRHLRKLLARGVLARREGYYRLEPPRSRLHESLLDAVRRMAV